MRHLIDLALCVVLTVICTVIPFVVLHGLLVLVGVVK